MMLNVLSRAAALTAARGVTALTTTATSTKILAGRRGVFCGSAAAAASSSSSSSSSSVLLHRGFSASSKAPTAEAPAACSPAPVFVVFGATGGIGEAVARKLHATHAGAGIVISGRNESKLSSIAASLPGRGTTEDPGGGAGEGGVGESGTGRGGVGESRSRGVGESGTSSTTRPPHYKPPFTPSILFHSPLTRRRCEKNHHGSTYG